LKTDFSFRFGKSTSRILIRDELPAIDDLITLISPEGNEKEKYAVLAVCDSNTKDLAGRILSQRKKGAEIPLLVLESGEKTKTWESVETILLSAGEAGLGRDGIFIGIGGGVICDLTGFAASIYMRGARLCLVATTLLGMVDASIGGKTGFDLSGQKNIAGTFYPAELVYLPLDALDSLPEREWKSGIAELIKTAVLDSGDFFELIKKLLNYAQDGQDSINFRECLGECISGAIDFKGCIVEADPVETGNKRLLLNLGHTFGHALETAAGLGSLSHGEAVAWGIARSCELGTALGITPPERAEEILGLLLLGSYEIRTPYPHKNSAGLTITADSIINAMMMDKKQISASLDGKEPEDPLGKLRFIVPGAESAKTAAAQEFSITAIEQSRSGKESLLRNILNGENKLET